MLLQIAGPGYSGGAALATVSFYVIAKDSSGKRIREGGADFEVRMALSPALSSFANS